MAMSEDQTPFLHDRDFADMLAKTCSELALLQERFRSRPSKLVRPTDPAGVARALLAERRLRDSMFPKGLFGEAAWDLLLTLYVARAGGEELNVTKACKLTRTAFATMNRLLERMDKGGLILRRPSAHKRSSTLVELSDDAAARMDRLLAEIG